MRTILTALLLFLFFISAGCKHPEPEDVSGKLKFVSSYQLDVQEPSGLSLSDDGNLWIVSDQSDKVFLYTKDGKKLIDFEVKGKDFEGIVQVDENTLALVSEEKSEIIFINKSGKEKDVKKIDNDLGGNSGIEGIAHSNGSFYLVNEKEPYLFTLNSEYKIESKRKINKAKDLSGMCYFNGNLWLISDESEKIYKCSLSGDVIAEYKIDIPQAEGIAIEGDNIYIVSDKTSMLYIYQILN